MRSLKAGSIKNRPIPNPKVLELMGKLTSIIDSNTDTSKHLENGIISSAVADIFSTEFTTDDAKLLQSHLNYVLSIHAEEVDIQNKTFEDHTTAYCKSLNLNELPDDEKEFIRYLRMMKQKGLVLEQKKLDFYILAIRLLAFTNETANPQFRIDRLMSKTVNKIVALSEEDGFDRVSYVNNFREIETKQHMEKNESILKKRDDSDDEEDMEPVVAEDKDQSQRRKLKAKVVLKKETFIENIFRTISGRF